MQITPCDKMTKILLLSTFFLLSFDDEKNRKVVSYSIEDERETTLFTVTRRVQ